MCNVYYLFCHQASKLMENKYNKTKKLTYMHIFNHFFYKNVCCYIFIKNYSITSLLGCKFIRQRLYLKFIKVLCHSFYLPIQFFAIFSIYLSFSTFITIIKINNLLMNKISIATSAMDLFSLYTLLLICTNKKLNFFLKLQP